MRYYLADCHFFHGNLNDRMDCRGFSSEEEMNEYMIEKWNAKVRKRDEVVILGDFSLGNVEETTALLGRLQGRLHLILGNHDHVMEHKRMDLSRFEWVKRYAEMSDNGRKVVLCHYPIFCYNGQYRLDRNGKPTTYMLYGHVHDTMDQRLMEQFAAITESTQTKNAAGEVLRIPCQMINCFCKYSDYTPLSLDEWIELDRKRKESLRNPT
ncbi:MAG: metallophosphoesterase family protein [Lachnospiraceae bacterium]|nr:metallophosphoesterase family protein [Lachnospiraceae bacterium]